MDEFEISVPDRELCSGMNLFWEEKDDRDVKNFKKIIKQHQLINWYKTPRLESWGRWSPLSRLRSSWKKRGTDTAKIPDLVNDGSFVGVQVKGPSGKDKGLQLFNLQGGTSGKDKGLQLFNLQGGPSGKDKGLQLFNLQGGPSGKDKGLQLYNLQDGDQSNQGAMENSSSASGDTDSETGFEKEGDTGETNIKSSLMLQSGQQTLYQMELDPKPLKLLSEREVALNELSLIPKTGSSHTGQEQEQEQEQEQQLEVKEKRVHGNVSVQNELAGARFLGARSSEIVQAGIKQREQQAQEEPNTQHGEKSDSGSRIGFSKGFLVLKHAKVEEEVTRDAQVSCNVLRREDKSFMEKTYQTRHTQRRFEGLEDETTEEATFIYVWWLSGGENQRRAVAAGRKVRGGMMVPKATTTVKIKFTKERYSAYLLRQKSWSHLQQAAGYISCMEEPTKAEPQLTYRHHMDKRRSEWEGVSDHISSTMERRFGGKENWVDRKLRSRSQGRQCRKVLTCISVAKHVNPTKLISTKNEIQYSTYSSTNLWLSKKQTSNAKSARKDQQPEDLVKHLYIWTRITHGNNGKRKAARIQAAKRRSIKMQRARELRTAMTTRRYVCELNSTGTRIPRCGKTCIVTGISRLWKVIHYDKRRWDKWKLTC